MTEIGPIVPLQTPDEEDRDALFFIERTRRANVLRVTTVIELPKQCYRELSGVFLVKPRRSLAFWRRHPSHEYTFFLVSNYDTIKAQIKENLRECISREIREQRRGALIVLVRANGVEVTRFNAVFHTALRALAHYDYKREEGRERWILLKRLRFRYERFDQRVEKGKTTVTSLLDSLQCTYTTSIDPMYKAFTVTITSIPENVTMIR